MKARFGLQQQPVKICTEGEKEYIFLCLNETEGRSRSPPAKASKHTRIIIMSMTTLRSLKRSE